MLSLIRHWQKLLTVSQPVRKVIGITLVVLAGQTAQVGSVFLVLVDCLQSNQLMLGTPISMPQKVMSIR